MTIAILGMGLLGAGMASHLAARGDNVVVWNRKRDKALQVRGVRVADTPADAVAGTSRVHLVLTDDAAVDAVLAALRPGLASDAIIIDHTTTSPSTTAARARRLRDDGVAFVHAPVFMSPANAHAGRGLMLAAGPKALVDAVTPALSTMTGEVWHVGERDDLAAFYKLCGNTMILTMAGAIADICRMADAMGLPRSDGLAVFQRFSPLGILQFRGPKMAARDFTPSFALTTARKDMRLMQEVAGDAHTAVLAGLAARMDALLAEGCGDLDVGVLAR